MSAADTPRRLLAVGAHPDDCDIRAGGLGIKYTDAGDTVLFVSLTSGGAGHQEQGGGPLARRRVLEAQAAGRTAGIEYRLFDQPDGELVPSLSLRGQMIRLLREFRPDLVITHRPNDYHPDHRAASVLVQDAVYLATVPNAEPLTPILEQAPVAMYFSDNFRKPYPFQADVAIDTDDVMARKMDMIACHESQVYEWLPFNFGADTAVPEDPAQRREWLDDRWRPRFEGVAVQCRDTLVRLYGPERGSAVLSAEGFEICEYGVQPTRGHLARLFPFFGG